jgi:hypothetical protein
MNTTTENEFKTTVVARIAGEDIKPGDYITEEHEEVISTTFAPDENTVKNFLDSVQNSLELKSTKDGVNLIRRQKQLVLRVDPSLNDDGDWVVFCNAFKLNPNLRTFDLTTEKLDPFLKDMPHTGLETIDLETRSLLQVLFFVAQGFDVPREHIASGVLGNRAPISIGLFCDYSRF